MIWSPFAEFVGWWLAFALLAFVMFGPLRRDKGAAQAYLFTVTLHIIAAWMYAYYRNLLPKAFHRGDTHSFHNYAVSRQWMTEPSFGIGTQAYQEALAQIYSLLGPSFFLGAILSVYAYAVSVLVLVKLMELLKIDHGKGLVVLLFGALPTAVLYGTVPMREPYQVLFFILACYSMLRFQLSSQPLHLIAAIMFALMMGILHKGLIIYAPFLVVIMLLMRVDRSGSRPASRWRMLLHRFVGVSLAIGFVVMVSGAEQQLSEIRGTEVLLTATTGEGLVDFTSESRNEEASPDARTHYGATLDPSSPARFVYSSVMVLLYYMFTPFPWQVSYHRDIYAFAEVVLRVACLVAIFRMWRRGGPVHPQIVAVLMVVYFSMALLWAGGTFTWGTATRHHMVHQWILLLLGVPALIQMRSGFARPHPVTAASGAQIPSGSRGPRRESRTARPRVLVEVPWPPPLLGSGGRRSGGLGMANVAPRPLAGRFGRPRRLTRE